MSEKQPRRRATPQMNFEKDLEAEDLSDRPADIQQVIETKVAATNGATCNSEDPSSDLEEPEIIEASLQIPSFEAFDDEFEFVDDIHGQVHLNRLERDVVDTPEFQRLFRLSQLG